jgi:hypothetical protein
MPDVRRVYVCNGYLYLRTDGLTATSDYEVLADGGHRHVVTIRGKDAPPGLRTLTTIASELVPGVPMAFAPAPYFGGSVNTWLAIETTDIALAAVWLAAAEGDDT